MRRVQPCQFLPGNWEILQAGRDAVFVLILAQLLKLCVSTVVSTYCARASTVSTSERAPCVFVVRASGNVGRRLFKKLAQSGFCVCACVRDLARCRNGVDELGELRKLENSVGEHPIGRHRGFAVRPGHWWADVSMSGLRARWMVQGLHG